MSSLELLYGEPFSGQQEELARACLDALGSGGEVLYVVPSKARADDVLEALGIASAGFFGLHLVAVRELPAWLASRLPITGSIASEALRVGMIQNLLSPRPPPFLKSVVTTQGVAQQLADLFAELERSASEASGVEEALARVERMRHRPGGDLAELYRLLSSRLELSGLVSAESLAHRVSGNLALATELPKGVRSLVLLVLEGLHFLDAAYLEVVKQLCRLVPRVIASVDYVPGENERFGAAASLFSELRRRARSARELKSDAGRVSGRVELLAGFDPQSEVEEIAGRIKSIYLERPTDFDPREILVVVTNEFLYRPLIEEVFPRYGVSFEFVGGLDLSSSHLVGSVMSILEVPLTDFSRSSVVKFFSSARLACDGAEGARSASSFVRFIARKYGVVEGLESWKEALASEARRAEETDERAVPPEKQDARRPEMCWPREKLRVQLEPTVRALEELAAMNRELAPEEFERTLLGLIRRFGVVERLQASAMRDLPPSDLWLLGKEARAFARFVEVLRETARAVALCSQSAAPLSRYAQLLGAATAVSRYVPPRGGRAVRIMKPLEARAVRADHVFFLGLADDWFPEEAQASAFYSEEEMRELGIRAAPGSLAEARYLFASLLAAARKQVFLSFPRSHGGNPKLPSSLLLEVEQQALLSAPLADAQVPPKAVCTDGMFYVRLGRELSLPASGSDGIAGLLAMHERKKSPDRLENFLRGLDAELRRAGGAAAAYAGLIAAPDLLERLESRFGPTYPFPVTRLEDYIECPFLFFLEEVLKLRPPDEVEQDVGPRDKGLLVHEILRRFYVERRNRRSSDPSPALVPSPADDPPGFREARKQLARITDEELARLPSRGMFTEVLRERLLGTGEGRPGLIDAFLRFETEVRPLCKPRYFEVLFGSPRLDVSCDPLLSGRWFRIVWETGGRVVEADLSGRVDRVDVSADGKFVVFDYKTGAPERGPSVRDIAAGRSLQLPIYCLAMEHVLREATSTEAKYEAAAAAYYWVPSFQDGRLGPWIGRKSLREAGYFAAGRSGGLRADEDPQNFRDILDAARRSAIEAIEAIRSGIFSPAAEARTRCRYCSYRTICRRPAFAVESNDGSASDRDPGEGA